MPRRTITVYVKRMFRAQDDSGLTRIHREYPTFFETKPQNLKL